MTNCPKFTLSKNEDKECLELKKDKTHQIIKTFPTKAVGWTPPHSLVVQAP